MDWLNSSLSRRFIVFLVVVLVMASLAFLALFLSLYSQELSRERGQASRSVSLLLQASLENAMLKRDLEGLQGIIERLSQQQNIRDVMILNPAGEVRFAARRQLLGHNGLDLLRQACPRCTGTQTVTEPTTLLLKNDQGVEVLRTVNPVKNRAACAECHGTVAENPVNGVLLVDYDAGSIGDKARASLAGMVTAGGIVLLLASAAAWWFMNRFVLRPVAALNTASRALATEATPAKLDIAGRDEMARLGSTFNTMAEQLQLNRQALQAREQFLQGVIDAIPDGLRIIDGDYRIIKANRAYCEQVGQPMEQVLQNENVCYRSSHGRDAPCPPTLLTCPLHEIRQTGEPLKCVQQFVRRGATTLPVEIFAAPMRAQIDGREQTLIVESARDLDKVIEYSHEQKLAGLGELAAGVAHEIHNPLSSLRIAVQASLRALAGDATDARQVAEYLRLVDRELDGCLEVTQRLLKLSALPGEQPQLIEVNRAVEDTLSLMRFEAQQQRVAIKLALDPSRPRVLAGDGDLRMIILNFAQNALHAMPHGGELWVSSHSAEGQIILVFEDTGIGIAAEILPRIFDPFFSRRGDGKKGTGLGLTIAKALIERYGGIVKVENAQGPGQGARFRVTLPDADSQPAMAYGD